MTGLEAEARLFGPGALAGGGTPEGAVRAAERLVDGGCDALLSFGLAGGLDPALRAGALLVPRRVLSADDGWTVSDDLLELLGGATVESLYSADAVCVTVRDKAALHARVGAAGVDLESGAVAEVARRRGVAFAVLRAVCDPAERELPAAALLALDASGAIGLRRVLGSVLRRPGQIPALIVLAFDAASARRALARSVGGSNLRALAGF